MKRIIGLLIAILSSAGISKATNQDTLHCLELVTKIEPAENAYHENYSIELWSEFELLNVITSESPETFRFELRKNVQYTILILNEDSVIKKVFINTKTPFADIKKEQKMEVILSLPDPADCKSKNCLAGTIDFDYNAGKFLYREGESDEGYLKNL